MKKFLFLFLLLLIRVDASSSVKFSSANKTCNLMSFEHYGTVYFELKEVSKCLDVNYVVSDNKISLSRNIDKIVYEGESFSNSKLLMVLDTDSFRYILYGLSNDNLWVSSTYNLMPRLFLEKDGKYLVSHRFISNVFKSSVNVTSNEVTVDMKKSIASFNENVDVKIETPVSPIKEVYQENTDCSGVTNGGWCSTSDAGKTKCGHTCTATSSVKYVAADGIFDMLNPTSREAYINNFGIKEFGWNESTLVEVRARTAANTANGKMYIAPISKVGYNSSTDCSGVSSETYYSHQASTNYSPDELLKRFPYCEERYSWIKN